MVGILALAGLLVELAVTCQFPDLGRVAILRSYLHSVILSVTQQNGNLSGLFHHYTFECMDSSILESGSGVFLQ